MKSAYPDLTVLKIGEPFFHSLSKVKSSSEMPRQTKAPGTSYSALNSAAKVQQNSETTKDLAKKNCLLLHHSALIAGASARQLKQSWHRVPSIRKINQLSCQAGAKWSVVTQAFRLQRYKTIWCFNRGLTLLTVFFT